MTFVFHAKATAFGAQFLQPACEVIPSQASVSLAATGGQGFDRIEKFNWRNVVSFDEATAYVSGTITDKNGVRKAETLATTRITNLNILNVVTAQSITASVTSVNTLDTGKESEVSFIASFEDLRIAGTRINPRLDTELFDSCQTYDRFKSRCQQNLEELGRRYGWHETAKRLRDYAFDERTRLEELGEPVPDQLQSLCHSEGLTAVPEIHGAIRASLVDRCEGAESSPYITPDGYALRVKGFGTIYVAEVMLKPGHRRLNMLRFEMGSPTVGNGSSNDIEGNGSDIPP